jgi:hypothetical protein
MTIKSFKYLGFDLAGREVSGTIEAADPVAGQNLMLQKGIYITKFEENAA